MYKDLISKHIDDLERQKQYLVNVNQFTTNDAKVQKSCRCGGICHSKTDDMQLVNSSVEEKTNPPHGYLDPSDMVPRPAPVPTLPSPVNRSKQTHILELNLPKPHLVPETVQKTELENTTEEYPNTQKEDEEWSILVDKINSLV